MEHKKTDQAGLPKSSLLLPNSLPKVILLLTHLQVKTVAKTWEMLAQMVTVGPKQTKGSYLRMVTTSLFENKPACTPHE